MNDIYFLPAEKDQQPIGTDLVIQYFVSTKDTVRAKSILTKNAISLVINGSKTMRFAEKTVDANDSGIHFLSAGNCIASIEYQTQEPFRSILLFFDEHLLTDFLAKQNASLKKTRAQSSYISLKKDEFLHHYIKSLELMLKNGESLSDNMSRLKFEELLQYLVERHPETLLSFQYPQQHKFDDITIRKVAEGNITGNLTVEELAFLCNMSASTFKRRFRDIYGTSPVNWFITQKMKMAVTLLSKRKTKPADVYHQLGYENHSSFTKAFRKYYGVSPTEYIETKMAV